MRFLDPMYAEAYIKMHGFDILLSMYVSFPLSVIHVSHAVCTPSFLVEILLVNQTANTLETRPSNLSH